MANLLDALNGLMTNPKTAGVMGLAEGLLSAGGPHRFPVSLGQGIASALGASQSGTQAAALYAMQQEKLKREKMMLPLLNSYYQEAQHLFGGQPTPDGQVPTGNAQTGAGPAPQQNRQPLLGASGQLNLPQWPPQGTPMQTQGRSPMGQSGGFGSPAANLGVMGSILGLPGSKTLYQAGTSDNPAFVAKLERARKLGGNDYGVDQSILNDPNSSVAEKNAAYYDMLNKSGQIKSVKKYDSTTGIPYTSEMVLPGVGQNSGGAQTLVSGKPDAALLKNMRRHAQAIANYQQPPLTGYALRSPNGQALMAMVYKLHPDYNAANYKSFEKTQNDFHNGKIAQQVQYINRSIEHIETLKPYIDHLANTGFRPGNAVKNAFNTQFGKSAPASFDALKKFVSGEVSKAIQGVPGGVEERQAVRSDLSNASSPQQLKAVLYGIEQLMKGQYDSLEREYTAATSGFDVKPGSYEPFDTYFTPTTLNTFKGMTDSRNSANKTINSSELPPQ